MQSSNDIVFHIQQNNLWSQLPSNMKSKLNNDPNEYNKAILNYSLQNQLRFKSNLISKVIIFCIFKLYWNLLNYLFYNLVYRFLV